MSAHRIAAAGLATALGLMAGGCSYDYLQHTDRVAYSAGDAVRTNMALQTTDPSKGSHYVTSGLGVNGNVIATTTTTGD